MGSLPSCEPSGIVRIPTWVADDHPNGFAFVVDGGGMSRVVLEGAVVVVDPDIGPTNGAVVAVELADGEPYMRRWHEGQDTLMLTADGYEEREGMVFKGDERDAVSYLGKIVWYQPDGEIR